MDTLLNQPSNYKKFMNVVTTMELKKSKNKLTFNRTIMNARGT